MNSLLSEFRKDCPMRHENGNCQPAGGFCTAVNDPICEALHNAYNEGYFAAAKLRKFERVCVAKTRTDYEGNVIYTDYYCPICGKQQKAKSWSGSRKEILGWYCERCGQKLKRSEK